MSGFWNADTMRQRVAAEDLVVPNSPDRVVNGAYELSLGSEVYVTSSDDPTKRSLEAGEHLPIPPGQFANLLTAETISVPPDALGLISVRFGLKQRGLVNVSGFHVDPGYSGHLLFSVFNAGPQSVVITQGKPVFLLWFASFDHPTGEDDLYKGLPRNEVTGDDVMKLQGTIANPQALAVRIDELERWRTRLTNLGTVTRNAVITVVIGLIVTALISLAVTSLMDGEDEDNSTTTSTSTTSSSTTLAPTSTTGVVTPTSGP